jgi:hypothetical protein
MASDREQVFERNRWITNDGVIAGWVDDIIWNLLRGPRADLSLPPVIPTGMSDAANVCRMAVVHNDLQGMIPFVYNDGLRDVLGKEFYDRIAIDRKRTEIFEHEWRWMLAPKLEGQLIPVEAAAARRVYGDLDHPSGNPRFISRLTLWAPTLAVRQEVESMLLAGGYVAKPTNDGTYSFYSIHRRN